MSKERLMRGVVCAALTFAASLVLWGHGARTSAQGPPPPPPADRPVEQTRKNIQVLKNLPDSQLLPEMNFIAASLGVQCGFCHVNKGRDPQTGQTQWVWESDEKEEKKVARDMMRMVLTINKGDFGLSRGQATCYTCHRGQEHPQNLPTLPLQAPSRPAARVGAEAPRQEQPTVQQVYDKYAAAVGSPEAVKQFQTQSLKGNATMMGRSQPYELLYKAPDKFVFVLEGSRVMLALTGDTGWVVIGGRARGFEAAELREAKRIAETLPLLKFTPSATMRVAGRRQVGERDAVVVVDRLSETVQRRYFFDAETGLLVRIATLNDAVLNQIPMQVDFEDYRDVAGVKMPFTVRVSSVVPIENQTRTITEVKHGVPIDDKVFEMPKQQ